MLLCLPVRRRLLPGILFSPSIILLDHHSQPRHPILSDFQHEIGDSSFVDDGDGAAQGGRSLFRLTQDQHLSRRQPISPHADLPSDCTSTSSLSAAIEVPLTAITLQSPGDDVGEAVSSSTEHVPSLVRIHLNIRVITELLSPIYFGKDAEWLRW